MSDGRQWGATCPRSDLVGAAVTAFTSPAFTGAVTGQTIFARHFFRAKAIFKVFLNEIVIEFQFLMINGFLHPVLNALIPKSWVKATPEVLSIETFSLKFPVLFVVLLNDPSGQ